MRTVDEPIKRAFDQVRAGEELEERTRERLARVRAGRSRRRPAAALAAAAACLVLLLAGLGGYQYYFTPTSVVSIDINPSLELGINRFDKVVTVQAWNDDGQALADSLELHLLDYRDALEQVVASQAVADRLAQGQLLSITVAGEDEGQCARLLAGAEGCTAGQGNVQCRHGDAEALEEAHHAGLSLGKYEAFLALQALDPTVTADDVSGLTMREILDWIGALESGSLGAGARPDGQGSGQSGHGNHHGWGKQE